MCPQPPSPAADASGEGRPVAVGICSTGRDGPTKLSARFHVACAEVFHSFRGQGPGPRSPPRHARGGSDHTQGSDPPPLRWAFSSGGKSARLITVRSVVRVHKGPPQALSPLGSPLWGCSSAGRAPALQAGGRRFESAHLHHRFLSSTATWRGHFSNPEPSNHQYSA
jgi:hypothetical protein